MLKILNEISRRAQAPPVQVAKGWGILDTADMFGDFLCLGLDRQSSFWGNRRKDIILHHILSRLVARGSRMGNISFLGLRIPVHICISLSSYLLWVCFLHPNPDSTLRV